MSTEDADRAAVDETRMSFLEHLSELRLRLRNAAIVFLVAVVVSFIFVKKYFVFLTRPARHAWEMALNGQPAVFHFASPTEPFWVYTKIAIIGALLAASPFVLWELWKFVAPGLYKKERRLVLVITVATAGCFVGGSNFRLPGFVHAGADLHVLVRRKVLRVRDSADHHDGRAGGLHAGHAAGNGRGFRAAHRHRGAGVDRPGVGTAALEVSTSTR